MTLAVAFALAGCGARGDEPKAPPSDAACESKHDADLPRAKPADVGIDAAALDRLEKRANEADSDAVVIVKDGPSSTDAPG
jgi:hypothetical protein